MTNTLRLLMPQWQGADIPCAYPLGARLLAFLAPKGDDIQVEVPVGFNDGSVPRKEEEGIIERTALMKQMKAARNLIEAYDPKHIVVFGGDCMVEQAPISYLNELYDGELGVIWMDAHPDITTPREFNHAHTMVLGNLLGNGDPKFANEVRVKVKPSHVLFAGLQETTEQETEVIERLNMKRVCPKELKDNSKPIIDWIKENDIKYVYIHLDLDVLDPQLFRELLFNQPIPDPDLDTDFTMGEMSFAQVERILKDVAAVVEVVGQGITEHLPWDMLNLKHLMEQMSIFNSNF